MFSITKQRLRGDIPIYKYISRINTGEGQKLFKMKNNVGTRTVGYELITNKFRLQIRRRFLRLKVWRLSNNLAIRAIRRRNQINFKMELDQSMKRII